MKPVAAGSGAARSTVELGVTRRPTEARIARAAVDAPRIAGAESADADAGAKSAMAAAQARSAGRRRRKRRGVVCCMTPLMSSVRATLYLDCRHLKSLGFRESFPPSDAPPSTSFRQKLTCVRQSGGRPAARSLASISQRGPAARLERRPVLHVGSGCVSIPRRPQPTSQSVVERALRPSPHPRRSSPPRASCRSGAPRCRR